jgi:hypothetical protein
MGRDVSFRIRRYRDSAAMSTADTPAVVVADDGELADIRELLDEFGVDFAHWRKGAVPVGTVDVRQLLVVSGPRAMSLGLQRPVVRDPGRAVWIAVLPEGSSSGGTSLLQLGFDYLVRRPVHPAALRHLLTQAVFHGDNRRRGKRVAVGYGITFKSGLRRHAATLIDLSPRGGRILSQKRMPAGTAVTLQLPAELADGSTLEIPGKILRVQRGELEGGRPSEVSMSIAFDEFTSLLKERLRAVLVSLLRGPSSMASVDEAPHSPARDAAAPSQAAPSEPASPDTVQRRRSPRGVFEEELLVFGGCDRAIVGCDLSREGMRIQPDAELSIGDTMRLAIEAGGRVEPIVVNAEVARDDGERGLGLRFTWIEPGGQNRIDQVVAGLPVVEGRRPDAEETGPVTVSTLVPGLLRLGREPADGGSSGRFSAKTFLSNWSIRGRSRRD